MDNRQANRRPSLRDTQWRVRRAHIHAHSARHTACKALHCTDNRRRTRVRQTVAQKLVLFDTQSPLRDNLGIGLRLRCANSENNVHLDCQRIFARCQRRTMTAKQCELKSSKRADKKTREIAPAMMFVNEFTKRDSQRTNRQFFVRHKAHQFSIVVARLRN